MKVVNGTSYLDDTPDDLIRVLEEARAAGRSTRLRLTYEGEAPFSCWVGRSLGSWKVPLALRSVSSIGGEPISTALLTRVERRSVARGKRRDTYGTVWERTPPTAQPEDRGSGKVHEP